MPLAASIVEKKVKCGVLTSKKDSAQIRVNQIDNDMEKVLKSINHKRTDNYHANRHVSYMARTVGAVRAKKLSLSQEIEGTAYKTSRMCLKREYNFQFLQRFFSKGRSRVEKMGKNTAKFIRDHSTITERSQKRNRNHEDQLNPEKTNRIPTKRFKIFKTTGEEAHRGEQEEGEHAGGVHRKNDLL